MERAATLGEEIERGSAQLVGLYGVADVRGNGLMIGIEVRDASGGPDYARVAAVKEACKERSLLLLSCGARIGRPEVDNATIRLLPALNIDRADLDRGLTILTEALRSTIEVSNSVPPA